MSRSASRLRVAAAGLFVCLLVLSAHGSFTQASGNHFLWSVRDAAGPPTYLVGSLHVLTEDYYPLSPPIEKAFDESRVLIEEVDLDELSQPGTAMAMVRKGMLTDGRTLDGIVPGETWTRLAARATRAGLPVEAIRQMKPWIAGLAVTTPALAEAGFRAELGVDRYFFDRAKQRSMERRALETVAYQVDRFDQTSMPVQIAMLEAVIADLDTQLANVKVIAEAWKRGDVNTLEKLLLGAFLESEELYERMLAERNRNWVAPISRCLQEDTACFVVVGAAHLVGKDGVPNLLSRQGYRVTQH